jgi:hypothetical protein
MQEAAFIFVIKVHVVGAGEFYATLDYSVSFAGLRIARQIIGFAAQPIEVASQHAWYRTGQDLAFS